MFQGLSDAILIDFVHVASDAATDQEAEKRAARGRRKLAAAITNSRSRQTARGGAVHAGLVALRRGRRLVEERVW